MYLEKKKKKNNIHLFIYHKIEFPVEKKKDLKY